ncbi:Trypanosomal VSG domain containing protein, putative [Trypanosoma equiperdum]|uniref:Trypanosomal VSG domain containing protein, putative n=1 Tax=Trypanosoma equiperdum TaxID=5694 RepID=A0A1G4IAF5_TRYEQ|nr:Trypanosomal VSG domain containing protein, putative [Trypanosoma equiperdum]
MKLAVGAAAVYFLLDVITRTEAAATDGVNAPIFPALCSALQLGDGDIEFVSSLYSEQPPLDDLYKLNMSLADTKWRASFVSKEGTTPATAKPKPGHGMNEEWQEKWTMWATAAADLAVDKAEQTIQQKYHIANIKPAQKRKLKQALAEITEAAHTLQTQQTSETEKPADDKELREQLLIALYGEPDTNKDQPENNKLFGAPPAAYATECAKTPPAGPAKSLAATIYCVCGTANTQSVKPCNKKHGTAVDWEVGTAPQASKWSHIRSICPNITKNKISANQLAALLEALKAPMNTQSADIYYGQPGESTCDGQANGACVKFAGAAQGRTLETEKITWLHGLQQIHDRLAAREQYNQQQQHKTEAIKQLAQLAGQVASRARYMEEPEHQQQNSDTSQPGSKDKQATACNNHQTNSTCAAANCKWEETEETKGTCKPKDGEGQRDAAGTEGTTKEGGAAATGCVAHKDKAACENDKTGDKQNFAFRKR